MTVDLILFLILAIVAIATALGMLLSRNAVYSALFLVLNFATVAIFYILLGTPFIAMAQITVYAGTIMVLFLFVIMLLGAEQLAPGKALPWQKPLAAALAFVLAVESVYLLAFLFHTVLGLVDEKYRLLRQALRKRQKFFQDMETLLQYILFDSWDDLFSFMCKGLELDTS